MKRVAIYARASTSGQSTEPQLDALRAWATRSGVEAVEFVDNGVSGKRDRRPALDALLDAVKRREVDGVAVVKLDRLARSMRHLTTLADTFDALGTDLIVLDQAVDTRTPSGKLLFGVLAAVAEFERELIVSRTRAGLAAAKRRGVRLGRKPVLDRRGVDRAVRLRRSGKSLRAVGEMLGVSAATVLKATR